MGGKGRSRTQLKHFKQNRENVWKYTSKSSSGDNSAAGEVDSNPDLNPNPSHGWDPIATQSPAFEDYYKEQGIVMAEEWDTFMEVLRKPLPAAFRINSR